MSRLLTVLQKAGINGFFLSLILMVFLAWAFPFYGTTRSPIPFSIITTYGVAFCFFFYGLRLNPKELLAGLSNWRLHTVIQLTTFVVFPLIVIPFSFLLNDPDNRLTWLGVFYLASLPSTVSSSVVMTSIAGGNLPAAIFNASISSIIGIFLTPLWMSLYISETGASPEAMDVIVKLSLQVLLPVTAGLILNRRLEFFTSRFKNVSRYFDMTVILLIVYTAFAESFYGNVFADQSAGDILMLALLMITFFLTMVLIMYGVSTLMNFKAKDKITIIFCGSKKSMVQGAVMGKVLFPNPLTLGIILLPLMLYHALQLLAGSIIAQRIAASKNALGTPSPN
jgi:solute carrier family 10 (sodium/bile acid cotransporter), member 7